MVLGGIPANAYVEDIRQGGRSVYDEGFILSNPPIPIEVSVNTSGVLVRGVVENSDHKPVPRVMVVLVPPENLRQNPGRYRTAVSDDAGKFEIPNVATGNYTAFAWEGALPTSWENAKFIAKYQDQGKILNVQPNGQTELILRALPAQR